MTFEKALEGLEKIVEELEAGDLSLDSSLKKYEEGMKLAQACQQKLDQAKAKVEKLMKKDSGRFAKEDFEEAEDEDE